MLFSLKLNRRRFLGASSTAVATLATTQTQLAAEGSETKRLRVLSYNIHHGQGVDGKLDLNRIARVILDAKPDVVALQEVDQNARRSNSVDQPAVLAQLTKMNVAFGGNIDLQGGKYGNAVLSRFPIANHQNHRLPNVNNGEQRGVLESRIAVPGMDSPLIFLATHLDHRRAETERVQSAKAINQLVAEHITASAVLAGDLNDVVGSQTLNILDVEWKRSNSKPLATIPVESPSRQIDFVLARPRQKWKAVSTQVMDEAIASDHRPIIAEWELNVI